MRDRTCGCSSVGRVLTCTWSCVLVPALHKPSVVVHTCNPIDQETETGIRSLCYSRLTCAVDVETLYYEPGGRGLERGLSSYALAAVSEDLSSISVPTQ